MTKLLQVGPIRLAILYPDLTVQKTLILPPPDDRGGINIDWLETGVYPYELEFGGRGVRVIDRPFIPKLSVRWSPYHDLHPQTPQSSYRPIRPGPAEDLRTGERPTWEQLIYLTSSPFWGRIKISPGMTAGGFIVSQVEGPNNIGLIHGMDVADKVELIFLGSEGRATKTLGDF